MGRTDLLGLIDLGHMGLLLPLLGSLRYWSWLLLYLFLLDGADFLLLGALGLFLLGADDVLATSAERLGAEQLLLTLAKIIHL